MKQKTFSIHSFSDWDHWAEELVPEFTTGTILGLSGPLGAGKTTFTQALARALGAEGDPRSPTFSLMRTYQLKKHPTLRRLVHIDAYRLEKPGDFLALNLEEEMNEPGTLVVIEWPENIQAWLERQQEYYWMTIVPRAGETREVRIKKKRLLEV
jgi:tRNA threonylcarbamoyladenosine biosynthesis protein TsaE